jgi:glycosyltransferase involved in cell wall biosynthesis
MRYCFFTTGDWEANASLVRLREFGREMIARGIDVSYVVDDFPYNRAKLDVNPKAQVAYVPEPMSRGQFKRRRAALRELRPDFVHVLNPYVKAVATLLGTKWPLVIDWDEWPARRARPKLRGVVDWWLGRWMRRRAVRVIVASRYLQDQLRQRFGVESVYVPYAAYLEPREDGTSPFNEPTVVYMGNLFSAYDHDIIFEAARLLKQRGMTPPIRFMGHGPDEATWRAFVRDNGLENVAMPGFVRGDELWRSLRHAHVLLFPIRPTMVNLCRCPSKTFAYAQARRPVITNRVGEIEAVLKDRAEYIDCTPQAFADAIERAMRRRTLDDVDYGVEQHNWSSRTDDLLEALGIQRGLAVPAEPHLQKIT